MKEDACVGSYTGRYTAGISARERDGPPSNGNKALGNVDFSRVRTCDTSATT